MLTFRGPVCIYACLQARDKGVGIEVPGRKSVFGGDSDQEGGDEGGDDDDGDANNAADTAGPNVDKSAPVEADSMVRQGASTEVAGSNNNSSSSSSRATTTKEETPTFFAEKGNGYACVTSALKRRGWQAKALGPSKGLSRQAVHGSKGLKAQQQASATLQWVHAPSSIDFDAHAEKAQQENNSSADPAAAAAAAAAASDAEAPPRSVQLVNHIPNNHSVLTSKLGLVSTLKSHFGSAFPPPWFPESYHISTSAELEQLLARNQELSTALSAAVSEEASSDTEATSSDEPIWIIKSTDGSTARSGANKCLNSGRESVQLVRGVDALVAAWTTTQSGAAKDGEETTETSLKNRDAKRMPETLSALDTTAGASQVIGTINEEEEEDPTATTTTTEAAAESSPLGTPVRGSAVSAARKLAASPPSDEEACTHSNTTANTAYVAQLENAAAAEEKGQISGVQAEKVQPAATEGAPRAMLVQRYVSNPLLLLEGGFKFDLRVFFLVARCGPSTFKCMVYNRGFTRRALQP